MTLLRARLNSIYDEQSSTPHVVPPAHPDFLFELQSWDHPATFTAVPRVADALYKVFDADKLGLNHFPPVEASIEALVQTDNLSLLSKDAVCPNKQCWVTEAHLVSSFTDPGPTVLRLSKLSAQAVGRNLAALVAARRQRWLSQACVSEGDKIVLLDAPVTPGHTFSPAVDDMLQHSHHARESTMELVHLLPKHPPPGQKSRDNSSIGNLGTNGAPGSRLHRVRPVLSSPLLREHQAPLPRV
ncbi:UNVERIFIED_CONTAM: hypothetical protein FKN15_015485 [Acipenser sinensis]